MLRVHERNVRITAGGEEIHGILAVPDNAKGVVAFAHGSGSSRFSPRNMQVAEYLHGAELATLLLDLLTPEEDSRFENRFNIPLLAERLELVIAWLCTEPETCSLPVGLFGASTGAAAALTAAASATQPLVLGTNARSHGGERVCAVVSRGGRPDLASPEVLDALQVPVLLIVGGFDTEVLALNRRAQAAMTHAPSELRVIPGATHLFEEPGAMEEVSRLAADWFTHYLAPEQTAHFQSQHKLVHS